MPSHTRVAAASAARSPHRGHSDPDTISRRPHTFRGPGESLHDPKVKEGRYLGHNAPYAQFAEVPEQIAAAGLEPGDTCPYYLVARDVTGNYSDTRELLVTVPDPLKPPAPWVIETRTDFVNSELDITFDHVNVENFHADHQRGRKYCNLDDARFEKELEFVDPGQSCDTTTRQRVRLDVKGYTVYRFREPEDARNFRDSDGDGVGDLEELELHPLAGFDDAYKNLTFEGDACNNAVAVGTYYRTDPMFLGLPYTISAPGPAIVQHADGRLVVEYTDTQPADLLEQTYWYRVQTVAGDDAGNLYYSDLSEPQRGLFHDLTKPGRGVDVDCAPGAVRCNHTVAVDPGPGDPLAVDETVLREASWLRLSCDDPTSGSELAATSVRFEEIDQRTGPVRGASFSASACASMAAACGGNAADARFLDAAGSVLGQHTYSSGFAVCSELAGIRLQDDCNPPFIVPVDRPTPATSAVGLECPVTGCFRIFCDVDGISRPLATVCDGDLPICFEGFLVNNGGVIEPAICPAIFPTIVPLPNLGGEPICLSVALVNENNVSSTELQLPCIPTFIPAAGPPQPLEFQFTTGTNNGAVSWLPPAQPVLGTLIEYFRDDGDNSGYRRTVFHEHADQTAADGPISIGVLLDDPVNPLEPEWEEDWCFRARIVNRSAPGYEESSISKWSATRCGIRTPAAQPVPVYLGWPPVPGVGEGAPLLARYLKADGFGMIHLAHVVPCITITGCSEPDSMPCFADLDQGTTLACPDFCDDVRDALSDAVEFVVYRQERDSTGAAGEFYQASPFIGYAYCEENAGNSTLRDPFIHWMSFPSLPVPWTTDSLVYVDRVPNIEGYEYRYQLLHFDSLGEIVGYRTSNWITAVGP